MGTDIIQQDDKLLTAISTQQIDIMTMLKGLSNQFRDLIACLMAVYH
ncbi:MAG: hypothetical protein R3C20_03875 [Planctomycetaceae bacterium]